MAERPESWTLGELAAALGARLNGPAEIVVRRPGPADTDDSEALTFAGDAKHLAIAAKSAAAAVLVADDAEIDKPALRVASPRAAFGRFLAMCAQPTPIEPGIHPTAIVHPTAKIDPLACVGPYVVVEREARIGARARVYAFAYIGDRCVIEEDACVHPHALLLQDVRVGRRSIVHAGASLGADGFGYSWDGSQHAKVPQVGGVWIEDDVEVGALTTIDRATAGATHIAEGVKIDNLVQIAHNVRIEPHVIIAAQTGIAGSARIGAGTMMGGRVGVGDHVTVGRKSILLGQAAVISDVEGGEVYSGWPAIPVMQENRMRASLRKLPEALKRIRALEARVRELEGGGE